jgi:hypothetical protein
VHAEARLASVLSPASAVAPTYDRPTPLPPPAPAYPPSVYTAPAPSVETADGAPATRFPTLFPTKNPSFDPTKVAAQDCFMGGNCVRQHITGIKANPQEPGVLQVTTKAVSYCEKGVGMSCEGEGWSQQYWSVKCGLPGFIKGGMSDVSGPIE